MALDRRNAFDFAFYAFTLGEREPRPRRDFRPPLKVMMLLHFNFALGPFTPESTRTSPAYTKFVKELLREKLIERPTREEQYENPGWAYRTTEKGDALVKAICAVPNPVEQTRWVIPS